MLHDALYIARVMNATPPPPSLVLSDAAHALGDVRHRIAKAVARAGRHPEDVGLVAVSKTYDAVAISPLIAAGQRHFGENRVQEAQAKWPALREATPDIVLHLVGQLQSNKADDALRLFDVIHSVDRPSLIDALARAQDKVARRPQCFFQVNLGGEGQKGGCAPPALAGLLEHAQAVGLDIGGLMTVPPVGPEPAPWFALLAKLSRDHGLGGLSMGMSGDFETAITLGATHVRVGTALFGARP
jgi:PLP dependent protein